MSHRLGALTLQSPYILAPLERVSGVGFRSICHSLGAGLTFTEMVRAKSIVAGLSVTDMIDTIDPATPTGIQLVAADSTELKTCLHFIQDQVLNGKEPHWGNIVAIDLNFGCPKPAIVKPGLGPAMLASKPKKVEAMFEILAEFRETTHLKIGAVGAKIRLGMNSTEMDSLVHVDIAGRASGVLDYLVVHGRHGGMVGDEPVFLEGISQVARVLSSSSTVLVGNGGIWTEDDVNEMRRIGACEYFMLARAVINNPWVLRGLTKGHSAAPTLEEVNSAENTCIELEARWGRTRPKHVKFRSLMFDRLRHWVLHGEMINNGSSRVRSMKQSYLSSKLGNS